MKCCFRLFSRVKNTKTERTLQALTFFSSRVINPNVKTNIWQSFRQKASQFPCRIALADGEDSRVIAAAAQAVASGMTNPTLVGRRALIQKQWETVSKKPLPTILDYDALTDTDHALFLKTLAGLSKYKNLSADEQEQKLRDPLILGCVATKCGMTDGFIGGAARTTADTLRAAFSIIGLQPHTSTLFGFFLIEKSAASTTESDLVLLADCAVTPEPSAKQLAAIGTHGAAAYEFLTGQTPRVAFLSFSTAGSAEYPSVDKMREALRLAKEKEPRLMMDGEWQADAALDRLSADIKKVGGSPMAGRANVLVVPDLNCGNIAYKLVQRLGGCRAVGPVLWGMAQPANDLSRGCSTDDIIDMMALTAIQVHTNKKVQVPSL